MRLRSILWMAVLCASVAPATANQALSGTLPPGVRSKILAVRLPASAQLMYFRFSAPPVNAGVNYALDYCIGPRPNPCGLGIAVTVPEGQTRLRWYSSTFIRTRVLTVGQGTAATVPYRVDINP